MSDELHQTMEMFYVFVVDPPGNTLGESLMMLAPQAPGGAPTPCVAWSIQGVERLRQLVEQALPPGHTAKLIRFYGREVLEEIAK